jgi:hypothetical protein
MGASAAFYRLFEHESRIRLMVVKCLNLDVIIAELDGILERVPESCVTTPILILVVP